MSGQKRREEIIRKLSHAASPVSGETLAKEFSVSRQVIVQDIALIRALGYDIISTNRGYLIQGKTNVCSRVFKVKHTEEEVADELNLFVDAGGKVCDVFIYHKVYGVVQAKLDIRSRLDVQKYMKEIQSGKSSLLSKVTSGYHYHTVEADSEEVLDLIQEALNERGFLAKLQDYEPVDFWSKKE